VASGFRPGLSTKSFTVLKYYGPMVDDGVVKIPPTATGQPLPVPPPNDTEQVGELIAQRFPVPSLVDVSANKNLALRRCGRLAGAVARWLNAERHPKRPSFAAQAWRYLVISAACLAGDDALSGHAAKQPGTSAAGAAAREARRLETDKAPVPPWEWRRKFRQNGPQRSSGRGLGAC